MHLQAELEPMRETPMDALAALLAPERNERTALHAARCCASAFPYLEHSPPDVLIEALEAASVPPRIDETRRYARLALSALKSADATHGDSGEGAWSLPLERRAELTAWLDDHDLHDCNASRLDVDPI